MRKLLSISIGLFLLIGCSSSSSLLKTANSFNIPEVSETLIAEAKPEIATGKLGTSGAIEYYSAISESLKEFKADDSLEFEDEQFADPVYIDDVDTLFEAIAPLIDEQLDY